MKQRATNEKNTADWVKQKKNKEKHDNKTNNCNKKNIQTTGQQ